MNCCIISATRHAGTLSRNEIFTYIKSLDWSTRIGVLKGLVIFTFLFCAAREKELHQLKSKHVQIRQDNCVYIYFENRKNRRMFFFVCKSLVFVGCV